MSDDFRPPTRFPRLALKVNAFLLFAALLIGGFAWLVAHKQGWFVHQTMIRVITPDALGISTGMPVALASAMRLVSRPSTISAFVPSPSSFRRVSNSTPSATPTHSTLQSQVSSNAAATLAPGPHSVTKLS